MHLIVADVVGREMPFILASGANVDVDPGALAAGTEA